MARFLTGAASFLAATWRNVLMALVSLLTVAGHRASPVQRILLRAIGITVLGHVYFGRRVIVYGPKKLTLGRRCAIGDNAHIACHSPISIGEDFLAAPGLYLNSGKHDAVTMKGHGQPIRIGNRVWCGVRVTICAGVEIGDDVVIGAGSVVVSPVPSGSIAVGVPARIVKNLDRGDIDIEPIFKSERGNA